MRRAGRPEDGAVVGRVERLCFEHGLRMTGQRRVVARVLSDAEDHPDVEEVHRRAKAIDRRISIATIYRTLRLFEDAGIIARLEFGKGRARYERTPEQHHDHLIDVASGKVIEFHDTEIEALQERIAARLGYRLVGHRLELMGEPLPDKQPAPPPKRGRS